LLEHEDVSARGAAGNSALERRGGLRERECRSDVEREQPVGECRDQCGESFAVGLDVSSEMPFQTVSSFDHLVTQWMSTVIVSLLAAPASGAASIPRLEAGSASAQRSRLRDPKTKGGRRVLTSVTGLAAQDRTARTRRTPRRLNSSAAPKRR
jgi:hypothetical protein